jgi:hypothetical protein
LNSDGIFSIPVIDKMKNGIIPITRLTIPNIDKKRHTSIDVGSPKIFLNETLYIAAEIDDNVPSKTPIMLLLLLFVVVVPVDIPFMIKPYDMTPKTANSTAIILIVEHDLLLLSKILSNIETNAVHEPNIDTIIDADTYCNAAI